MSISKKINIAVIGATGYTGLDLIFILSNPITIIPSKFSNITKSRP